MAQSTPLFVGLDVHKDSIAVAHAAGAERRSARVCRRDRHAPGGPRQTDPAAAGEDADAGVCLRGRARAATLSIAT